ncbi:TIM barrel protein [Candidatus Poribacteria bacterium]|nr:TIM barrel protein [Candidatus Poribacteria bacterium]
MFRKCIFADEVSKDFDEAVRLCRDNGAEYIEVRGGIWGKNVTNIDDVDIKKMQDVLDKYDMKIGAIGSPFGKCSFEEEDYQKHMNFLPGLIELAHIFDTKIIRMFAFWVPKGLRGSDKDRPNIDDYIDEIASRLKPAADLAEKEDVILALETEGATMVGTCAEARTVIDGVNSNAIRVAWDVNNSWHCGELPYPDGYDYIRGLVSHVHVKPNSEKNIDTIGNSNVSYAQVLRVILEDEGYEGCASIEHWGSPELMLKGLRELDKVLKNL